MDHPMITRRIELGGISYITHPLGQDSAWYYGADSPAGDLYEALESAAAGREVPGSRLFLVRFPDGKTVEPLPEKPGLILNDPLCWDGKLYILAADIPEGTVTAYAFDEHTEDLTEVFRLPLADAGDGYNLLLHSQPLTLSLQPNDGTFTILYPEKVTFSIGERETFNFRDGDRLYFTTWYEDPDYREETVAREAGTGRELDRFAGDIRLMPDGTGWHIS